MARRLLPKISVSLTLLVCGGLWLAGGVSDFDFGFKAFCGSLFIGFALCFALSAAIGKAPGYLFFTGFLATIGTMLLLDQYGGMPELKFDRLWMLLIAAPGMGSLLLFLTRKFASAHLKFALLFLGVAALLYLGVGGIVAWAIMIPAIVVLIGLIILTGVLFRRDGEQVLEGEDGCLPYPDESDDEIENNEERKD